MNKRVVRRTFETFFRRWWLYLLPFVLFAGVGVLKASKTTSGYQSTGVIDVASDTVLSQLTSIRGENFGYETPANATTKTMNSLLRTDRFIETIAESADLTDDLAAGTTTADQLRQAISVTPDGDTLLQVRATTDSPELSAALAEGTIDSFLEYVVSGDVSQSRAAEDFFSNQLVVYKQALEDAGQALKDYAAANPGGPLDLRPLDEQIEIQRLTGAVDQATAQYTNAQQKSEEARLATEQATGDVNQRLRIVDSPDVPILPEPHKQQAFFTAIIFMVVGSMLTVAAVILATVADRSFRTAEDVEQLLGMPMVTVVPEVKHKRKAGRSSHRGAQAPAAAPLRRTTTRTTTAAARPADTKTSRSTTGSRRSKAPAMEAARTPNADPTLEAVIDERSDPSLDVSTSSSSSSNAGRGSPS
jgi:uncharacterized protein involved in exopolysaccharide biosynthesis